MTEVIVLILVYCHASEHATINLKLILLKKYVRQKNLGGIANAMTMTQEKSERTWIYCFSCSGIAVWFLYS
jgi:hypothetical protein